MSKPSFHAFTRTLRAVLQHKAGWLADESDYLAKAVTVYGQQCRLELQNIQILYLSAYFKNLGAVYLPESLLTQRFSEAEQLTAVKSWHLLSGMIARQSGLDEVCTIMDTYYHRGIPDDQMSSIFQVVNVWSACRHPKGYREPLSEEDARVTLRQRALMEWSDPAIVEHFLETFQEPEEHIHAV